VPGLLRWVHGASPVDGPAFGERRFQFDEAGHGGAPRRPAPFDDESLGRPVSSSTRSAA